MIKNEHILEAIGMINEEVVKDAKEYNRSKVRLFRPVLISACLCVALFGSALAVEFVGGVFSAGTRTHPQQNHLDLFELSLKGTTAFKLDEVLADIEVLAEKRDNSLPQSYAGLVHVAAFESWKAAAEYIGIPLASNTVLDQCAPSESLVGPTTDERGNPIWLHVGTSYLVEDTEVFVNAYLRTDHAGEEKLYTPGISYDTSQRTVVDKAFEMSDGSAGIIFKRFDDSSVSYNGAFIQDGIFYWITTHSDPDEVATPEELLYTIMAAY